MHVQTGSRQTADMMQTLIVHTRDMLQCEQHITLLLRAYMPDELQRYLHAMRAINDSALVSPGRLQDIVQGIPSKLMRRCGALLIHMVALANGGGGATMRDVESHIVASTDIPAPYIAVTCRQAENLASTWHGVVEGARIKAVNRMIVSPTVDEVVEWLMAGDERAIDADVNAGFELEMARALRELVIKYFGVELPVYTLPNGDAHIKPIDLLWALCKTEQCYSDRCELQAPVGAVSQLTLKHGHVAPCGGEGDDAVGGALQRHQAGAGVQLQVHDVIVGAVQAGDGGAVVHAQIHQQVVWHVQDR